ncbi:MAG: GNAT family N-acetyltransferase [Thermoproteota archaeon]
MFEARLQPRCSAFLAQKSDTYFAICLKSEPTLIGLLAFNHIDENKQLELGYQIHSRYQDNDFDREALALLILFSHIKTSNQ